MSEDATTNHERVHLPILPTGRAEQVRKEIAEAPAPVIESEGGAAEASPPAAATSMERKLIEGKVIAAISKIYDPEIPVNIYELGLIYKIEVDAARYVKVTMTLTAPACPVAGSLPGEVEKAVESIDEVRGATVDLVWDPPWSRDRMSESALLALGMM
jgi:FeS assembly SUF system protein